jgi:hypothetical protein
VGSSKSVFVARSRHDLVHVLPVIRLVEDVLGDAWSFVVEIPDVPEWFDVAKVAIRKSAAFVLFASTRSSRSEPCMRETRYAMRLGKPGAVVLLEQSAHGLFDHVRRWVIVDGTDTDETETAVALARFLDGVEC